MTTLEELGLLKMDFLALRNLTVLDDVISMVFYRIPGIPKSPAACRRAFVVSSLSTQAILRWDCIHEPPLPFPTAVL